MKQTFTINGMHCASCVARIESALKEMNGVSSVAVNLATGTAFIDFDLNAVSPVAMKKKIDAMGYTFILEEQKKVIINIGGLHCASCVARLQSVLTEHEGVHEASVNLATNKAFITYSPARISLAGLKELIAKAGYKALGEQGVDTERIESIRKERNFKYAAVFSLPLLVITMLDHFGVVMLIRNETVFALVQLVLATPAIIFGREFYINGIKSVVKAKTATMDTLVALGTGTAYLYSVFVTVMIVRGEPGYDAMHLYYETAAVLITFILFGRFLEARARGKTSEAIKRLMQLAPKTATVVRDGKELEVQTVDVVTGDIVVIKSGQRIPVDGMVIDGYSAVDESMITGESIPVEKKQSDKVLAGTINGMGSFRYNATSVGKDTVLSQIIRLVEEAQASKAPIQKLADKVSAVFVPTVMLVAVASFVVWKLLGYETYFAAKTFIAVMIIACPCSLGLATPTAIIVGTGMGAERGVLFKNAEALEKLSKMNMLVLDKTGTLTVGKPEVVSIQAYSMTENELLKYAASLEKASSHPLAEAVLRKYGKDDLFLVADHKTLPGKGIEGRIGNMRIFIGTRQYLEEQGVVLNVSDVQLAETAATFIFVGEEDLQTSKKGLIGALSVLDAVKDDAKDFVSAMNVLGIKLYMLSGDNEKVAESVAKKLTIERYKGFVLPDQKQKIVNESKAAGYCVGMAGDGINDSPALAAADVSIAFGSGTDIAMETSDIVLVKANLMGIVKAIKLSHGTLKKIKQNLFWAFIYNSLGIPVAAGVLYPMFGILLNPMVAGLAMALSSVSVVTNSLLMKKMEV